jgi:ATP-dependent helicase HrpB
MLVRAGEIGLARTAAQVAVLLGERGLGGNDADLELRLRRWGGERGDTGGEWAEAGGPLGTLLPLPAAPEAEAAG